MGFQHMKPEKRQSLGRKGGRNNVKKHGLDHFSEIGLKGGLAVVKKYGREHFVRIGNLSPYRKDKQRAEREENGQS